MTLLQKIEAGLVATLILAAISLAFWLGKIDNKVTQLEGIEGKLGGATEQAIRDVQRVAQEAGLNALPKGIIVAWTDQESNIPTGWAICDGTRNTPDLRDRFLRGGTMADIGQKGGVNQLPQTATGSHVLTLAEMPKHTHIQTLSGSRGTEDGYAHTSAQQWGYTNIAGGKATKPEGGNTGHSHSIPLEENRPLFFTVLYIMKVQ